VRLYFITDRMLERERTLPEIVRTAVEAGVDLVQLREKDLPGRALFDLAEQLTAICHAAGARLLINDRLDVALASGADGVHLPANGLPVAAVRAAVGEHFLVGASTHSADEAARAERDGADFVVLGPVFTTPSKLRFGPPIGLEPLRAAVDRLNIPIYAIGGVDAATVEEVRNLGLEGVALIRAIMDSSDIAATVRRLAGTG
jgi:thiamine-phosphate pyrophosphorylase